MKRFKSHCVDKQTNKLTYTRVTDSNENKTNSQRSIVKTVKTIGVPIVTCLHKVRRIHKAFAKSSLRLT